MPNTINASFGLDVAPLKAGWEQAKAVSRAGAAQVASVMKQGLAKAESASRAVPINWANVAAARGSLPGPAFKTGASFAPAPRGKYPSPASQMAEEGGEFKLPKGIGHGLGVMAAIHELAGAYKEASAEAVKLREANASIFQQTGGGTAASGSDLEKKLSDIAEVNNKLRERNRIESQGVTSGGSSGAADLVKFGRKMTAWSLGEGNFGEQDKKEAEEAQKRQQAGADAVEMMGKKQSELNDIEKEGRTASEEGGELMRAELNNRERLLEITKQEAAAGLQGHSKRADAENERYKNERAAIEHTFKIKSDEQALEQTIATIRALGLTTEKESLAVAEAKVKALKEQQAGEPQKERSAALTTKIMSAENELRGAQYNAADQSPDAVKARNAAALEGLKHQSFNTRMAQMEDPNREAYGAQVSGIGGVGPKSAPVAFRGLDSLSGGMSSFGGTDKFNNFFHPQPAGVELSTPETEGSSGSSDKPLTKADMESVMQKYWGGN